MTVKQLVRALQDYALDEEKQNMEVTIPRSDLEDLPQTRPFILLVDGTSESGYKAEGFKNVVELRLRAVPVE